MPTKQVVELRRLAKHYGAATAVADVSLSIERGEVICLLGPSGCGKTTTLKMLAGFVIPSSGQVLIEGSDVSRTPPHKRDIGMVFQNYALFPHMTVEANIAFAPQNIGMKASDVRSRVSELLELTQLAPYVKRYPKELSGGQQQRVALARALAVRPAVLLLDEPFSNLDAKLRAQMREELRGVIDRLDTTTLFVTHDQEEALVIADRIVIMNLGRVEQIGSPNEVYDNPQSRFVAQFMGRCNFVNVAAADNSSSSILLPNGQRIEVGTVHPGAKTLAVRPEHIALASGESSNQLAGVVSKSVYLGPVTHVTIDFDRFKLVMDTPSDIAKDLVIGKSIRVRVDPRHARLVTD